MNPTVAYIIGGTLAALITAGGGILGTVVARNTKRTAQIVTGNGLGDVSKVSDDTLIALGRLEQKLDDHLAHSARQDERLDQVEKLATLRAIAQRSE